MKRVNNIDFLISNGCLGDKDTHISTISKHPRIFFRESAPPAAMRQSSCRKRRGGRMPSHRRMREVVLPKAVARNGKQTLFDNKMT